MQPQTCTGNFILCYFLTSAFMMHKYSYVVNEHTKTLVGVHFTLLVMRKKIHDLCGQSISHRHGQNKSRGLLWRSKIIFSEKSHIESVFGILNEQVYLVSSFPRSAMVLCPLCKNIAWVSDHCFTEDLGGFRLACIIVFLTMCDILSIMS